MNEIVKQEETPPSPGAIRLRPDGRREAWDAGNNVWRILSKSLLNGINPFDPDWKPAEPITTIQVRRKRTKQFKEQLVDANGVRLCKDRKSVNLYYYPYTFDKLMASVGIGRARGTGVKKRERAITRFLSEAATDDEAIKKYVNPKTGYVRPEAVVGLYVHLQKMIFSRPEVVLKYFEQIYKNALENPVGELERFQKMTGVPLQMFVGNQGEGPQYVQLNVMSDFVDGDMGAGAGTS